MIMIHLTEQGYNAGLRLCLSDRNDGERNVHAAYAPLGNTEFRKECCPACLKVWADEAYDDDDEMPDYIKQLRNRC